jgi:NitT/TauT family transport system substrate-binding protein
LNEASIFEINVTMPHAILAKCAQFIVRETKYLRRPQLCKLDAVIRYSLMKIARWKIRKVGGRSVCIWFLCISLIVFATGCGQKTNTSSQPGARKYRIGLGPWIGFGPLYLAQDKGFFKDAGCEVELIVLTGIAERNSALKSGRIDALAAPVDYFVLSAGNNLEATIVMAIDESVGGDGIVARKEITRFEDLRGKRLAFQRGLPSEFFVRALLLQHGVKLNEVRTVDMETDQAGAAFISGKVDAAAVWEPWLTKASEQGGGHVLASTKEFPNLIVDCLGFNQKRLAEDQAGAKAVVDAIFRAINYWKEHPEEADAVMAPHFQLDPQKYAAILTGARFCDVARNREFFGTADKPGPIFSVAERASEIWGEAGTIKAPVKAASIISDRLVKGE